MVKQLEGLFAELSATVYGLPLLVWRIGRSPVRGSLRLYVRHRLKRDAHIGPHTAVLLTGFLLSVWTGQNDRVRQFAGGLIAGRGLTEPIVMRGCFPRATSEDVTTGPQPPPPMASQKPPSKPSALTRGP